MKFILLPTDFSKNSLNAIDFGMKFFKDEECRFYLMNVQKASSFISDDMLVVSSSATIYNTIVDAAKKSINNIITGIKKRYRNDKHEFHSIVDYDNFTDAINQVCETQQIDLILMGTKGASGLEKVFFGSNTIHVIQRCTTPVLVIPNDFKFSNLSKVVFATTNLEPFATDDVELLKEWVHDFNSELAILHIADQNHLAYESYDNHEFFNTNFKDLKHDYIDTSNKDMLKEIYDYIHVNKIKMLVIKNKKHSFIKRLFAQSGLETLAFKIDIPFFVLPCNQA
ncbi:universal stress protein [Aestuariivivens sediminicola]|uniref:universal stress protein n=1 Tax=Aestuariivivens sediminicola TaxID=2913560 RepID=UPI001F566552|nr:universal stress protein [Aestuariivivens sediminicola]